MSELPYKTFYVIDQNAYILRHKAKMKEIMFCWKKKCNFVGKAALLTYFPKTKEITQYQGFFSNH